jgi:hypothetical protein
MNNTSIIKTKRHYMLPAITLIKLDNEISLALESNVDPNGEPGNWSKAPDYFKNDPFKSGLA